MAEEERYTFELINEAKKSIPPEKWDKLRDTILDMATRDRLLKYKGIGPLDSIDYLDGYDRTDRLSYRICWASISNLLNIIEFLKSQNIRYSIHVSERLTENRVVTRLLINLEEKRGLLYTDDDIISLSTENRPKEIKIVNQLREYLEPSLKLREGL